MIWTGREETSWGFQPGEEPAPGLSVLAHLGGSEYEAYLAQDETGRQVVVKLVRPHMVDETYPLEGLRREADVLGALDHPAIVKLIRVDLSSPRPHLVLDHSEGRSLADLVSGKGPMQVIEAASIGLGIALAVDYLAGRGFVHLDIKPHNVIVGKALRVIDFGIARSVEDAALLRSPTGTDAYMAPEQCRPADVSVGPAADVWGLGATMHFALTGRPPFPRPAGAPTGNAGRWPQLTNGFAAPPEFATEIRPLLEACLEADPARRPSAAEIADAMKDLL
ncbi:MAG: serine/threonine-protein kinase [Actinomycetota bacterium]